LASDFIAEMIVEVLTKFEVDGAQLDDHFACPKELSKCTVLDMNNAAARVSSFVRSKSRKIFSLSPAIVE